VLRSIGPFAIQGRLCKLRACDLVPILLARPGHCKKTVPRKALLRFTSPRAPAEADFSFRALHAQTALGRKVML
jgi:hypothetical protein